MSKTLIVGSVAYDIIFSVEGDMRDELPLEEGKVRKINVTLIANKRNQYFGGTGANIAYGIGLLGGNPMLFSAVGEDFKRDFEEHLTKHNVDIRVLKGEKESDTSHAYQISDKLHQQIVIWQPNVYYDLINEAELTNTIDKDELSQVQVAIFSPGTSTSTLNNLIEFSNNKNPEAISIFDPSQINNIFEKDKFLQCLNLSTILICNDIELAGIKNRLELDIKDIINNGPQYVVETKGAEGSIIHTSQSSTHIGIAKPKSIVETTGAGDAYRAGLVYGLSNGKPIEEAAKIGAVMGSFCVETYAGQTYTFTKDQFDDRLDTLGILNIVK